MMTRRHILLAGAGAGVAASSFAWLMPSARATETFPFQRSDAEWRSLLKPEQYAVLRQSGTERPYTSPLLGEKRRGDFACAGCDLPLFSSTTKYDSGTGWPSFWAPLDKVVGTESDRTLGMMRTSVHCSRCGGHQGHVFNDGPKPTGLRYCMNGVSMIFKPAQA